jgi:hypothetical protein
LIEPGIFTPNSSDARTRPAAHPLNPLAVGGIEKMSGRSVARQPSDGFGGTEERQCGLRAIGVGPFEEQDC